MGTLHLFRSAPEVIAVSDGGYIFRKGERAKVMYLIIEGDVDLVVHDTVVETARDGTFIGEMALIDDAPRSASARARGDCRVFPIDETRFQSLVQQTPFFALQLMKTLVERLRRMDARIGGKPPARKKAAAKKTAATKSKAPPKKSAKAKKKA
jgi:CRP/FNR family cyclic AMP-dependent transcriptional regulator